MKTKVKIVKRGKNDSNARLVCRNKTRYKASQDAWQDAVFFYVRSGGNKLYNVYLCTAGHTKVHYHLTTNTKVGDLSHIPPEYREIFKTFSQQFELSFFTRLRRFLL